MVLWVNNPPAMQETQEMQVSSLGWEDPLEEENGNPLHYSCLKNPMDREAWWATVQRVTELDTTEWPHSHMQVPINGIKIILPKL